MKRLIAVLLLLMGLAVGVGQIPAATGQEKKAPAPDADVKSLVEGNNEFAFDLYKRLAEKEKNNIVFSPYSISTAIAMAYGGTSGDTAKKMANTMHFTLPKDRFHPAFGRLTDNLLPIDKDQSYELFVANGLWAQKDYPFLEEFLLSTQKHYRATLQQVDFAGAAEQARGTINRWVEEQTKNKINNLLPAGVINPTTRLVLTNAIYLKALWVEPFIKVTSKKGESFEVSTKRTVSVPMMYQPRDRYFNYVESDGFQWLELPYKGDRLAMVVLLPLEKGKLPNLEQTLTRSAAQKAIDKLQSRLGDVALPRFKVILHLNLLDQLQKMGMQAGPLTEMAQKPLAISHIFHKAYIAVDEVGTEAAAATAVVTRGISNKARFIFRADHPFLFLLRDTQTGSILFLGRVTDPSIG